MKHLAIFNNDATVLGLLIMMLTVIFVMEKSQIHHIKQFFKYVPALLLCYFIPSIFNSTGVISGEESNLYFIASRYLLPASLVLLTLSIDLKKIISLGPKAIIMLLTGTFGILVGSGVSVIETMHLVKKVVDNRVYELAIEGAANQIENGSSISDALKLTGIFPGVLIQLMNTGEETGEIDKLALKVSDFYAKQVDAIVDRLTSIIEPALIILIGVIIGVVLVAVYMPIFKFGSAF